MIDSFISTRDERL